MDGDTDVKTAVAVLNTKVEYLEETGRAHGKAIGEHSKRLNSFDIFRAQVLIIAALGAAAGSAVASAAISFFFQRGH